VKVLLALLAVIGLLYALHRVALWAEGRGWVYYLNSKPSSSTLGNAFLEIQSMIEPQKRPLVEARKEEAVEEDEQGEPLAVMIRAEEERDHATVRRINLRAFETTLEADLVDAVRPATQPLISLVAEFSGEVVGHILFTPVTIRDGETTSSAIGLGPMAVLPELQRRTIGSRLVEAGLEACRELGENAVVVLGHADYYPRFGFRPATEFGLHYRGPDFGPFFFVAELENGALEGLRGMVEYLPEFENA
jgi:putative acetyltransferase